METEKEKRKEKKGKIRCVRGGEKLGHSGTINWEVRRLQEKKLQNLREEIQSSDRSMLS